MRVATKVFGSDECIEFATLAPSHSRSGGLGGVPVYREGNKTSLDSLRVDRNQDALYLLESSSRQNESLTALVSSRKAFTFVNCLMPDSNVLNNGN